MANPTHVSIIRGGAHNLVQWRAASGFAGPIDLSGATFPVLKLQGVDLRGADLSNMSVGELDLSAAHLEGANLAGLKVELTNAVFRGAFLDGATLTGVGVPQGQFNDATMTNAKCDGADLTRSDLTKANLTGATFTGTKLLGCKVHHANLTGANLSEARIAGADFHGSTLDRAKLTNAHGTPSEDEKDFGPAHFPRASLIEADLTAADLRGVRFHAAQLVGARLDGADLMEAQFRERAELMTASLRGARLAHADLDDAGLIEADLSGASCVQATFRRAKLCLASLGRVNFERTELGSADFEGADVNGANFNEARIDDTAWRGVRNLNKARNLVTARVLQDSDPHYVDEAVVGWFDRWLSWERIRTVGRLPLFGVSYFVLLLIPAYLYFLAWYNAQVDGVQAEAQALHGKAGDLQARTQDREHDETAARIQAADQRLARLVAHTRKLPIPSWPLMTLGSSLLLAIASTTYAVRCPARIKEFTLDAWRDQLRRPVIHYLPVSWSRPAWRAICGSCYVIGGSVAVVVIARKVWTAGVFIVEQTLLSPTN